MHTFYEFFAGGGMARLGLGANWQCLLANDIDPKKVAAYQTNFGKECLICSDIAKLKTEDMPGVADLAWASFPCQDLSLAGNRVGLSGDRSGTFWGFWSAINKLKIDGRAPKTLVLENVCGLLTSNGGKDFAELCRAISTLGYFFGAVTIDAQKFLPQSRPRLFVICVRSANLILSGLKSLHPNDWHSRALCRAYDAMESDLKARWVWWKLPKAEHTTKSLADLIESEESHHHWNSEAETNKLLRMMSPVNAEKVRAAQRSGKRIIGTIYKRTRVEGGKRKQRAEVRFDGVAGCLRTPGGGSSRQSVIVVEGAKVRTRLLSVREAARLMGVQDGYLIPDSYNEGYHIFGDGLAVPVVAFIANNLLLHLIDPSPLNSSARAA